MTDDNRIPDMRGDHPTLNALCELCKVNFPPVEFWPWVEKSGKSPDGVVLGDSDVKQLKGSSTAGCHLCSVLLESILPERMIAEIDDDGSMDRSTFQLLMLPDVEGWVLRMKMDQGVRDFPVKQAHKAYEADGAKVMTWNLDSRISIASSRIDAVQTCYTTNLSSHAISQIKSWL